MSRLSPQSASGVLVLIAGLAVVHAATSPSAHVPEQSEPAVSAELALPALEGVDLTVQRVLFAGGKAEVLGTDQLPELPPEVARILIGYGVTLTIPEPEGRG